VEPQFKQFYVKLSYVGFDVSQNVLITLYEFHISISNIVKILQNFYLIQQQLFVNSLAHSVTHISSSLPQLLFNSFVSLLNPSVIYSLTKSLINSLLHSVSLIHSLIQSLINSLSHSVTH